MIAIVDDEPRIHDVVSTALKTANIAKDTYDFFDPVSFVESLSNNEIDPALLILDVHFENTGLTGVDVIPHIRETHPYLPIILLTGMERNIIEGAQKFECTYYIPKPIDPKQLVQMIQFYLGLGGKCGERLEKIKANRDEYDQLIDILEEELLTQQAIPPEHHNPEELTTGTEKTSNKIVDILTSVLDNYELLSSFRKDMNTLLTQDFSTGKRVIDSIITLDKTDSMPGQNIHKVQGTTNTYSVRITHKIRLLFYKPDTGNKRRLLRIDTHHDTKGIDKWLKNNRDSYAN